MTNFEIHPQLVKDCHVLGRLDSTQLLLNKNAILPWFILVPKTEHQDLFELDDKLRQEVMQNAYKVTQFVKAQFKLQKINFAAIGNVVPQLHLHIVGRYDGDPCWPQPVWGNLSETRTWQKEQLKEVKQVLVQACQLQV